MIGNVRELSVHFRGFPRRAGTSDRHEACDRAADCRRLWECASIDPARCEAPRGTADNSKTCVCGAGSHATRSPSNSKSSMRKISRRLTLEMAAILGAVHPRSNQRPVSVLPIAGS